MCNKCNNKPERPVPLVAISPTPSKEKTTVSLAYTENSASDTIIQGRGLEPIEGFGKR